MRANRAKAGRFTALPLCVAALLAPWSAVSASAKSEPPASAVPGQVSAPAPEGSPQAPSVGPAQAAPKEGDVRGHRRILIVRYHVVHDCVVQPNAGRAAEAWTIPAGATINWRYNVNRMVAAVSDPRGHSKGFPWWGFVTDSSCIGTSVGQTGAYQVFHRGRWVRHRISYPAGRPRPTRSLQGRSQFAPYWRRVDYTLGSGARPKHLVRMRHNATLRDRPNRFVIGNVLSGRRVRSKQAHPHGWTRVYVPVLHRWGYVIV